MASSELALEELLELELLELEPPALLPLLPARALACACHTYSELSFRTTDTLGSSAASFTPLIGNPTLTLALGLPNCAAARAMMSLTDRSTLASSLSA